MALKKRWVRDLYRNTMVISLSTRVPERIVGNSYLGISSGLPVIQMFFEIDSHPLDHPAGG
jgi:hypothetical protein